MNAKTKNILIISGVALALAILFAIVIITNRIPLKNENVVGNTAGNLNNHGLFCENDGKVYFSNAYDNGCLYVMNPDETGMKKLTTTGVSSINADDRYLYYYLDSSGGGQGLGYVQRTYGLYRSKKNGSQTSCLKRQYAIIATLVDNNIYYQNYSNQTGTELYKIRIDGKNDQLIKSENLNPACAVNGMIYYNAYDSNHHLYALNTANDSASEILSIDMWAPTYKDGYIYYMDLRNNYRLSRVYYGSDNVEVLTQDRPDFYNVTDYYIYYATGDDPSPALKRIGLDGSNPEIVAEGVYCNLNATSQYLYFTPFDANAATGRNIPVYRTPVNGSIFVQTFDAALNAAMENNK